MVSQRRTYRVAEKIRETIASELSRVADPRFSLVTITSAVVSPDLRNAKIYWMAVGGRQRIPEVDQAFESASGLFKRALSKSLNVRFMPALKFFYDDTLDTVEQVESLFRRINSESNEE